MKENWTFLNEKFCFHFQPKLSVTEFCFCCFFCSKNFVCLDTNLNNLILITILCAGSQKVGNRRLFRSNKIHQNCSDLKKNYLLKNIFRNTI